MCTFTVIVEFIFEEIQMYLNVFKISLISFTIYILPYSKLIYSYLQYIKCGQVGYITTEIKEERVTRVGPKVDMYPNVVCAYMLAFVISTPLEMS